MTLEDLYPREEEKLVLRCYESPYQFPIETQDRSKKFTKKNFNKHQMPKQNIANTKIRKTQNRG